MEIRRRFYRLPELAARWGCSVSDLLHMGSTRARTRHGGALRILVDTNGFAGRLLSDWRLMRLVRVSERESKSEYQQAPIGRRSAEGVALEVSVSDLLKMEQPGAFPYELTTGTFRRDEWRCSVEMYPAFKIEPGNLFVTAADVATVEAARQPASASPAQADDAAEIKPRERDTLLKIIYGMARLAPFRFDPAAQRSGAAQAIADATEQAGCAVTDDTVRKWLKLAAEHVGKPNSGSA